MLGSACGSLVLVLLVVMLATPTPHTQRPVEARDAVDFATTLCALLKRLSWAGDN